MKEQLIAPCGMNCSLCIAYQFREKDLNKQGFHRTYCSGCIPRGKNCTHMGDKCELLRKGTVRFCYECEAFPCKRLKSLDKRYRTKYHMSMIENLKFIQENGMDLFLKKEENIWRCPDCDGVICCHNGLCMNCNLKVLLQNKKYRWNEEYERSITVDKLDYKKVFKELYLPKRNPDVIDVPEMSFAIIDGEGDPNGEEFSLATAALYSFSYAVKMSYKSKEIPQGFYDYTVFPLEGVWDLVDKTKSITDKSNFAYSIMIRQPDFLTNELFKRFIIETKKKKPNGYLDKVKYETITEGLCCQMLHVGSYDDEPESFEIMNQFCIENGYERSSSKHREIYLSDPRKTETGKLKTVLRFKVKKT